MAITGTSLSDTEDFISPRDPCRTEADGATIFVIGALDHTVYSWIVDNGTQIETTEDRQLFRNNVQQRATLAVEFGLREWRNFKDKDGGDLKFETQKRFFKGREYDVVTPACMSMIPPLEMAAIGDRILQRNTLTEVAAKN